MANQYLEPFQRIAKSYLQELRKFRKSGQTPGAYNMYFKSNKLKDKVYDEVEFCLECIFNDNIPYQITTKEYKKFKRGESQLGPILLTLWD